MAGKYNCGWDWMPSASSAAAIAAFMEMDFWFFQQQGSQGYYLQSPGFYGYGQALGVNHFTGSAVSSFALRPQGQNNSAGGWVSATILIEADGAPPGVGTMLHVYDAVNNQCLASISFETNGVVTAYRGGGIRTGTKLGSTPPGTWRLGVVMDVEVEFVVNSSTGSVLVRIDETPVLSLINQNTQPGSVAYFDSVGFGWETTSNLQVDFVIDNFRHYDTTGAQNNTWLGTRRVQTSLFNGDGGTTDFTRSNTGLAHWQNAINTNVDDSLYLYDSTVSDFNLGTIQPTVNASAVIDWIRVSSYVRQDDATQRHVKNRIVSSTGPTTADGASYPTTMTYGADSDIWELDPGTGLSFTGAGYDALQGGLLIFS